MAEANVPEAWIGDDVVVLAGENLQPIDGPLLEVNNRGVVIRVLQNLEKLQERRAAGESVEALRQETNFTHYFLPWRTVQVITRRETQADNR